MIDTPERGLVISAITGREAVLTVPDAVPEGLADRYRFPSADLVGVAAAAFTRVLMPWRGEEGPRARIVIAPGCVAIERRDLGRLERTAERRRHGIAPASEGWEGVRARERPAEAALAAVTARSAIAEWSRRSRSRMTRAIGTLDLGPLLPRAGSRLAMVTLTYPGDWLTVAPDGATVKRHLKALRKRWEREFGVQLAALWKLEFQGRGAPHFHLLANIPPEASRDGRPFRKWIGAAWADVVGHPDPEERARHERVGTGVDFAEGLRARDPRRIGVYFTKHGSAGYGSKEYQHKVPAEWAGAGPGRFWGYWGLQKAESVVEVAHEDADTAARYARRWSRAQGITREVWVTRGTRRRRVRRRAHRMPGSAGFVLVNDGPSFASQLAKALALKPEPWQLAVSVPI